MSDLDALAERLAAVERAVTGGETDLAAIEEGADVVDRLGDLPTHRVDRLQLRLRREVASKLEDEAFRVEREAVGETASIARDVASELTATLVEAGANRTAEAMLDRWRGRQFVSVPAGLPLTPIPGFWYVTANAWDVTARGTYARFAVSARTGTPDGRTSITYSRDGSAVELALFDDGTPEVLGYATRVSFNVSVPVVVVVPPGGTGVGDVDGESAEESDGWPDPGPDRRPGGRVTTPYTLGR